MADETKNVVRTGRVRVFDVEYSLLAPSTARRKEYIVVRSNARRTSFIRRGGRPRSFRPSQAQPDKINLWIKRMFVTRSCRRKSLPNQLPEFDSPLFVSLHLLDERLKLLSSARRRRTGCTASRNYLYQRSHRSHGAPPKLCRTLQVLLDSVLGDRCPAHRRFKCGRELIQLGDEKRNT